MTLVSCALPRCRRDPHRSRWLTRIAGRRRSPGAHRPVAVVIIRPDPADVRRAHPRRSGRKESNCECRPAAEARSSWPSWPRPSSSPSSGRRPPPPRRPRVLQRFMNAIGQVESGGNYYARNRHSGAYGKYQIMPSNWPSWAGALPRELAGQADTGQPGARRQGQVHDPVPQARQLAAGRPLVADRVVPRTGWSASSTRYVNRVMRFYRLGIGSKHVVAPSKHISEKSGAVTYTGTWKPARFGAYAGDAVRYATRPGRPPRSRSRARGSAGTARPARPAARPRSWSTADTSRPWISTRARSGPDDPVHQDLGDGRHAHPDDRSRRRGRHPMVAIDEFVVRQ